MFHKTKNKNNIGTIAFKNYFKQLPAAGFERNLENVQSYEGSYSKNY